MYSGSVTGIATMENSIMIFQLRIELACDPEIPLLGIYPKNIYNSQDKEAICVY